MFQEILTGVIVMAAVYYIGYRIYTSVKKKQACTGCAIMEAYKKQEN